MMVLDLVFLGIAGALAGMGVMALFRGNGPYPPSRTAAVVCLVFGIAVALAALDGASFGSNASAPPGTLTVVVWSAGGLLGGRGTARALA